MAPIVFVSGKQAHRDDLVDDARQFTRSLAAFHLRLPNRAIELVGDLFENADKDHCLARRMLEMLHQPDDLAGEQAISAARIWFAVLLREGFGARSRPRHRLAGQVGDAVDEDDLLARDHLDEVRVGLAEVFVVALGEEATGICRRIDAANKATNVEGIGKGAYRDAVALPVLNRLQASL